MNLRDYIHFNNLTVLGFAKKCDINIQTLYGIMKGVNARYFDICKIIAVTGGAVDIWDILPPEAFAEIELLKEKVRESETGKKQIQLPTNEELMERAQKARWGSKFSGMCC